MFTRLKLRRWLKKYPRIRIRQIQREDYPVFENETIRICSSKFDLNYKKNWSCKLSYIAYRYAFIKGKCGNYNKRSDYIDLSY